MIRPASAWALASLCCAAIVLAGCGSAARARHGVAAASALRAGQEQQLLALITDARSDATRHDGNGARGALIRFVAQVKALRARGTLSAATVNRLTRQAQAASRLIPKPPARRSARAAAPPNSAAAPPNTAAAPPGGQLPGGGSGPAAASAGPGAQHIPPGQARKALRANGWGHGQVWGHGNQDGDNADPGATWNTSHGHDWGGDDNGS